MNFGVSPMIDRVLLIDFVNFNTWHTRYVSTAVCDVLRPTFLEDLTSSWNNLLRIHLTEKFLK
jgi:hypothetical protein